MSVDFGCSYFKVTIFTGLGYFKCQNLNEVGSIVILVLRIVCENHDCAQRDTFGLRIDARIILSFDFTYFHLNFSDCGRGLFRIWNLLSGVPGLFPREQG